MSQWIAANFRIRIFGRSGIKTGAQNQTLADLYKSPWKNVGLVHCEDRDLVLIFQIATDIDDNSKYSTFDN